MCSVLFLKTWSQVRGGLKLDVKKYYGISSNEWL